MTAVERDQTAELPRPLMWMALLLDHNGVQTPIRVQLFLHESSAPARRAEVVFEGSALPPAQGFGESALSALTAALVAANEELNRLRTSGVRVLVEQKGFGLELFSLPLQRAFQPALERYGFVKPAPDAEIVAGPTPHESGVVRFVVRVKDRLIKIVASADGVGGAVEDNLDDFNVASGLVHTFLAEQPQAQKLEWYRQAAQLRRAAANPRPYDFPRLPHISVVGEPTPSHSFVQLTIAGANVPLVILFSHRGGVLDDCEDWSRLNDADRNAAFATAIDYALAHPDELLAAGLDIELFTELYS